MSGENGQQWEFRDVACAVCGSRSYRIIGFHGGEAHRQGLGVKTRVVACSDCSLIYANPMPFPVGEDVRYQNVAHYFDGVMGQTDEQRSGIQILADAERLLPGTGRLLDVGCGRGAMVKAAVDRGWEAEGCDISEDFARYAREAFGVHVSVGSLEEIRFPDESFDVVTVVEVIEHLYDPAATMTEVHRILRPGGLAFVSTPNEASIYQRVGNLYYRLRRSDWCVNLCPTWNLYHILGFSPRSLRYLLTEKRFSVEELVCYPGGIPLPQRGGFWGKMEQLGGQAIEHLARLTRSNPYMYAWGRRLPVAHRHT